MKTSPGTPRTLSTVTATVLALVATATLAAPPGTIRLTASFDEHNFSDVAKVAIPAAIRTAQIKSPGSVVWAGYENMDGFLFAYVQIAARNKSVTTVTVDAGNGRAVGSSTRTAEQVAADAHAEQAADAEKAKDPNSEEARKAREVKLAAPKYKSSIKVATNLAGADLALRAKIDIQKAMNEAAHGHPGKIVSAGVSQDHGFLVYDITIKAPDGTITLYVIDAGTGALLGNEAGG